MKRVAEIMAEIAAASRQQLSGIEQVGNAVTQMDQVTQQNASIVEESAASAGNMASLAEKLNEAVARFRLDDDRAHPARSDTLAVHVSDVPRLARG